MIIGNFIQDFKDGILQNISDDHFSDQRLINELNWASSYIFRILNVTNTFSYAAYIETLTPDVDNSRRYTTTYRISGIIEDVDTTNMDMGTQTKSSGVLANDEIYLKGKNLILKQDEGDFYIIEQSLSGPQAILTAKEYSSIEVKYKRLSRLYTIDDINNNNISVDMPEDLLGVLQNIMFWRCFPKNFLENGWDIGNAYLNQGREELAAYTKELAAQSQRFTA